MRFFKYFAILFGVLQIITSINSVPCDGKAKSGITFDDSTGKVINGKKEGAWIYYNKGKIVRTSYFKNNVLEGLTLIFYENGMISRSIPFENGLISGKVNFYSHEGDLITVYNYRKDVFLSTEMKKAVIGTPPKAHAYYPMDDY